MEHRKNLKTWNLGGSLIMSIVKNELPILEFDTEQLAVLNPTHENLGLKLPKKCVFAFLGAYIDVSANIFVIFLQTL